MKSFNIIDSYPIVRENGAVVKMYECEMTIDHTLPTPEEGIRIISSLVSVIKDKEVSFVMISSYRIFADKICRSYRADVLIADEDPGYCSVTIEVTGNGKVMFELTGLLKEKWFRQKNLNYACAYELITA